MTKVDEPMEKFKSNNILDLMDFKANIVLSKAPELRKNSSLFKMHEGQAVCHLLTYTYSTFMAKSEPWEVARQDADLST